jgi:hypothetical protein
MGTSAGQTPGDLTDPIERLRGGDRRALAALFDRHRDRLRRTVELRLDPRLRARLDASDVVQGAFLDVARDLDAYLADPKLRGRSARGGAAAYPSPWRAQDKASPLSGSCWLPRRHIGRVMPYCLAHAVPLPGIVPYRSIVQWRL